MDKHELGYQPTGDDQVRQARTGPGGEALFGDEWIDPRKGDLFELLYALTEEK